MPTCRPSGSPDGPAASVEHLTRLDHLGRRRHHRDHDPGGGVPRRLTDRRHLVAQEVAVLEAEPDAALAQERVRLLGHRQVGQWLVPADVEGPQRDRSPPHGLSDRVVLVRLLLDVWGACSCPGTGTRSGPARRRRHRAKGPRVRRSPSPGWPPPRSGSRRRDTAGFSGERELPCALLGGLGGAALVLREQLRRGIDVQLAGAAVEQDDGAFRDVEDTSEPAATTTGMSRALARMAACEVGLPSARSHAGHQVQVQVQRSRQGSGLGHQDPLRGDLPSDGSPVRARDTCSPDGVDVGRSLPQVGVGQARPLAARPRSRSPCQAATASAPAADPRLDVCEHLGVG